MWCFFDLVNADIVVRDEIGAHVSDIGEAVEQIHAVIAEFEASGELQDLPTDWEVAIRCRDPRILAAISIR